MTTAPREEPHWVPRAWAWWEGRAAAGFYLTVLGLVGFWLSLLPFDATDLCYLLSLEDHVWVTQEMVHPLWVPLLWIYRFVLRGLGWRGFVLVPIEIANVLVTAATLVLMFRLARRRTNDALAAGGAVLLLAACPAFCCAGMRPTPYAPAFLCLYGSALILGGERRPSPLRCLAAGALAGITMSLHASAMALGAAAVVCVALDPDRESWSAAAGRVAAYGTGMLAVALAAWTGWALFNGLDISFFRPENLRAHFAGVEQVPGTSIYSSGSWARQAAGLSTSLLASAPLLLPGLPAAIREGRRARSGAAPPGDVRLLVASLAVFGAVAGFFLVNNNRNGFIYAGLALLPLLVARAASRGTWTRRALGLTPIVSVPLAVSAALSGTHRFNDPLPAEIRFVESTVGPRAVLLTPGCAFSEIRLLSQISVFQVEVPGASVHGCPFPWAEAGEVLRSRIRSWRDQGVTAYYAYGDEERDFSGDANGREKDVQLFWSPELVAKERAPRLQAVRAALASAGLRLEPPFVSPHGARYSKVTAEGAPGSPPREIPSQPQVPTSTRDPQMGVARSVLDRFHALVPADPWADCDALCLGFPYTTSPPVEARSACGCPGAVHVVDLPPRGESEGPPACHFGPGFSSEAARGYIVSWAQRVGLGAPGDSEVSLDGERAQVRLELAAGALRLSWRLLDSCEPGPVELVPEGLAGSDVPSADAARDFAVHLPAPHVRAR
jgi:hypothetical protein